MSDDLDRIRAQYTGAHRCDPPGSVTADVLALLAALDAERARAERLREHVAALQRCLGQRSPDEPESYATAVGAAMREGIAAWVEAAHLAQRQERIWSERWETLARGVVEQIGHWEACGLDVAVERMRKEARRAAIEECVAVAEGCRSAAAEDHPVWIGCRVSILDRLRALLTAPAPADTPRT